MRRGTTPTNTFTFPFAESEVQDLYITYAQKKQTVIEKSLSDVIFTEDGAIELKLSQEDTLCFSSPGFVYIQIRVLLKSGDALASDIIQAKTEEILKEGVI